MMDPNGANQSSYMMPTQPQQSVMPPAANPPPPPTSQQPPQQQQQQPPPSQQQQQSQQTPEIQRKQFIQKQLVLLLHAHKCQQREKQTINGETRPSTCTLPHCSTMKTVLQHMTKCSDHKTCPIPHCVTSRQIILHWKQCNNPQCPICQPLKTPSTNKIPNANPTNPNGNPTGGTAPFPTPINKEWQKRVTQDMRNHLVQKIITALIPATDSGAMRDKRIINLANYARRVENETFDVANNQEEYFHKLAEKIYKIQKDLEERRERKRIQDMQLAAQITLTPGQTVPTNELNGKMHPNMDIMAGDQGPPNRIAPGTDYLSSNSTGNSFFTQATIKSEPTMTQTSRTRMNNAANSNTGAFTVTNVPSNNSLSYLLNGDTTSGSQSHELDMMDTSTHLKNEPMSPKNSHQVCSFDRRIIKKKSSLYLVFDLFNEQERRIK